MNTYLVHIKSKWYEHFDGLFLVKANSIEEITNDYVGKLYNQKISEHKKNTFGVLDYFKEYEIGSIECLDTLMKDKSFHILQEPIVYE